MEKKIVDELIGNAITMENALLVTPIIRAFTKGDNITPIPVTLEMDGIIYTKIKSDGYTFEASSDGERWRHLSNKGQILLYEALEAAGCLDNIE